jgi:excisionase family DNA binding protein
MEPKAERAEISVAAAACRLGVGLDFVYILLRSGKLVGRKVNRQWLVSTAAVEERRKRLEARNDCH